MPDLKKMIVNPFYAINIAEGFADKHEPLISKAAYIKANVRLIEEIGAKEWLQTLLKVLTNNGK